MTTGGPSLSYSERVAERVAKIERLARGEAIDVRGLLDELVEPAWPVRRAVVQALAGAGAPVVAELTAELAARRDNEARLAGIVDALSLSSASVEDSLLALTTHANPAVVCDAIQVLGRRASHEAVPALERLTQHEDDNVALAAVEALGRIGGPGVVGALLALIESGNFFRTFPAVDALGRSGDLKALPALLKLLANPLYAAEAARAVGRLGDLSAVAPLANYLVQANDTVARVVASALTAIHERSLERFGSAALVERVLSTHPDAETIRARLRESVARADASEKLALSQVLAWMGEEETVATLLALLDGGEAVAAAAVNGLSALAAVGERQLLIAVREGSSEHRRRLVPILNGRRAALPVLLECLQDEDPVVRVLACAALARIGDTSVVPELFPFVADPDLRVAQAALGAVHSLGSEITKRLAFEAVTAEDPLLRRAAFRIIGYFGYDDAFELVRAAVGDADERVRDAAISALATLEDPRAKALALETSRDASARTRAVACRVLAQVGELPGRRERLREALGDPDPWVRYYACQALGHIRDEAAANLIADLIADGSGQVRVAALDALARLPGRKPFEVLNRAAQSADMDVQRAALIALGISRRREAFATLEAALTSPQPATRLVAVSALAELDVPESAAAIARAVADADASVRNAAIAALAERPGAAASHALLLLLAQAPQREELIAALSRPVAGRVAAILVALQSAADDGAVAMISALARMHTPEAEQGLRLAFQSSNDSCRRAAAAALVAAEDALAREALARAALGDPDPEVRRISAGVLAR